MRASGVGRSEDVVVIGAGLGGLTTAALLLKAGRPVIVLEGHTYPGGSAGTFYHQGYRFDAGATLAGGFGPAGPFPRLGDALGLAWPVSPVDPAWVVHLPEASVTQWTDRAQWRDERRTVFPKGESFWDQQETLASIAWELSARSFPWPPHGLHEVRALVRSVRPSAFKALPYLRRTIREMLPGGSEGLRQFLDTQLLISAQATSEGTNAIHGSAALDMPRRGTFAVTGGMGALARVLADWIQDHGGRVLYRQQVTRIETERGIAVAVRTRKGLRLACNTLVANLTPWALNDLLGEAAPPSLRREVDQRPWTWGALALYLGLEAKVLPEGISSHHQILVDPSLPLGEGNTVFLSLSEAQDASRAPQGMRAATVSTHTAIRPWLEERHKGEEAYLARRAEYTERLLSGAETAVPGIRSAVRIILPATPLTFEFFTGRPRGMVGGLPQASMLGARGPHTGLTNAWLVGDSVFPGQSTAGVVLSGMRVAEAVLAKGVRSSVKVSMPGGGGRYRPREFRELSKSGG